MNGFQIEILNAWYYLNALENDVRSRILCFVGDCCLLPYLLPFNHINITFSMHHIIHTYAHLCCSLSLPIYFYHAQWHFYRNCVFVCSHVSFINVITNKTIEKTYQKIDLGRIHKKTKIGKINFTKSYEAFTQKCILLQNANKINKNTHTHIAISGKANVHTRRYCGLNLNFRDEFALFLHTTKSSTSSENRWLDPFFIDHNIFMNLVENIHFCIRPVVSNFMTIFRGVAGIHWIVKTAAANNRNHKTSKSTTFNVCISTHNVHSFHFSSDAFDIR